MKVDSKVSSTLKKIGLRQIKHKPYIAQMEKRFGQEAIHFLNLADRKAADSSVDLYSAKNQDLDMSLLISSSQFYSNHAALLTWLLKQDFGDADKVVDLGCENGVLTCAMALLWPEKNVVGIDINSDAIEMARRLAHRHSISNVEFIEGDISQPKNIEEIANADTYLAAWLTHECLPVMWKKSGEDADKGRKTFSISDITPELGDGEMPLESIRSLLSDRSKLITVNRFPRFEQSLSFHRAAEKAGLQIKFPDSDVLTVDNESGTESFPILSYMPSRETPENLPRETLFSLVNYKNLRKKFCAKPYEEDAAEAIWTLSEKRLEICTLTLSYPEDDAKEQYRLALNDMFGILFRTSNLGYRSCVLAPACALDEMLQHLLDVSANVGDHIEQEIRFNDGFFGEPILNAFSFPPEDLARAFSVK